MGKVYTEQEFTMYVNTGIDLSEAANVFIEGTKPDGTSMSYFTGSVSNATQGIIRVDVEDTDFDSSDYGTYTMWAKVDFNGGDTAWGEPFHLNIYSSGT